MKNFGLKRSNYKIYICDEMGSPVECYGYKNEREFEKALYDEKFENAPFKAYTKDGLYCKHVAWNNSKEYDKLVKNYFRNKVEYILLNPSWVDKAIIIDEIDAVKKLNEINENTNVGEVIIISTSGVINKLKVVAKNYTRVLLEAV